LADAGLAYVGAELYDSAGNLVPDSVKNAFSNITPGSGETGLTSAFPGYTTDVSGNQTITWDDGSTMTMNPDGTFSVTNATDNLTGGYTTYTDGYQHDANGDISRDEAGNPIPDTNPNVTPPRVTPPGVTPPRVVPPIADPTTNMSFSDWAKSTAGQEVMRNAGFTTAEIAAAAGGTGAAYSWIENIAKTIGLTPDTLVKSLGGVLASVIGAVGSTQQADSQTQLGNRMLDMSAAQYADQTAREQARYEANVALTQGNNATNIANEQARFNTLAGRENAAIQRQQDSINTSQEVVRPFYTELQKLQNDPTSFLTSERVQAPIQQGTDALARSLSAKVGNPIDNPSALQEIQNYTSNAFYNKLGERENQLAGWVNLPAYGSAGATIPGTGSTLPGSVPTPTVPNQAYNAPSGSNSLATAGATSLNNSFNSTGQAYSQLGAGINNIFNPPQQGQLTLQQLQQWINSQSA
jgi:hypothetical protein